MQLSKKALFFAAAVTIASNVATAAPFVISLGDVSVYNLPATGIDPTEILLTGIPAATYQSYSVTVEWTDSINFAYSSEAIFALTDAPLATAVTFYADPGPSPVSLNSTTPTTLTWAGGLAPSYTTGSTPLYFLAAQTFSDSGATWGNVTITLSEDAFVVPTPTAIDLGTITGDLTTSGSLGAPGEVDWYKFTLPGDVAPGDFFDYFEISTGDGTLADEFDNTDTELALYTSAGVLVATNDDSSGFGFASILTFGSGSGVEDFSDGFNGDLAAGEYYLSVSGFNSSFTGGFGVTPGTATGAYPLIFRAPTVVPEPFGIAPLAFAAVGLIARRRRRMN